MRYAVTYSPYREWDDVDTLIVETDTSPLDMAREQLMKMFETYIGDTDIARFVVQGDNGWFCRNLEDTDINMVGQ